MAKLNINGLSVKELRELRSNIDTAIAERKQTERAELKRKMSEMAAAAGLSLAEVLGTGRKRGPIGAKYRNPDNHSETWSGRGRQPRWLVAKLKKGAKREDFLIG
jgi:DNA-binding protein H-NS